MVLKAGQRYRVVDPFDRNRKPRIVTIKHVGKTDVTYESRENDGHGPKQTVTIKRFIVEAFIKRRGTLLEDG